MKEICSLMAPFHAYGGTRCSWTFFSGAVENPNMLNDGVLSLLCSLLQDGPFGLPWRCCYQFSAAAQVHLADVKWFGMSCDHISFNLIIPLPCKNDGRLCCGPRRDAAFTKSIWVLLHSHHMSCYTANWIPAAWWRRSDEQPLVHAWVGLRGADKQVAVYNCPASLQVEGFLLCFSPSWPAKALHPVAGVLGEVIVGF